LNNTTSPVVPDPLERDQVDVLTEGEHICDRQEERITRGNFMKYDDELDAGRCLKNQTPQKRRFP
jgi:hypothetical protein